MLKADTFKNTVIKLLELPLWVKQIVYLYLRADIKKLLLDQNIDVKPSDLIQFYKPKISFLGKKELQERNYSYEDIKYNFLTAVLSEKTFIDITLDSFLTLAETCDLFLWALQCQYIMKPKSQNIVPVAQFYAGRIKTGEYLYRMGRLTVDELDKAIKYQERLKKNGKNVPMATLLAQLGMINKNEIESVLIMKQEAHRRLIFNGDIHPVEVSNSDLYLLSEKLKKVEYENIYLRKKLNTLLVKGE